MGVRGRGRGRGRAQEEQEAEEAPPAAVAAAVAVAVAPAPPVNWLELLGGEPRAVNIDTVDGVNSLDGDAAWLQQTHAAWFAVPPPPPAGVVDDAAPVYNGPPQGVVSKVVFTVTAIPSAADPDEIAGLYVRFMVRDPDLNPGKFIAALIRNAETRRAQAMQGSDKRSFRTELFPNYAMYFGANGHPASSDMTHRVYFDLVTSICPELLNGDIHMIDLHDTVNVDCMGNPFHPTTVLTTERACRLAVDAGCDPTLMLPSSKWWSPNTGVARFPDERTTGVVTYMYSPEQVFWHSPVNMGLATHYFPFIKLDDDFLATLVAGGDIDAFLDINLPLEAGEDGAPPVRNRADEDRFVRTTFHDFQELLRKKTVITRSELAGNTLIKYQTGNEFVHRAAEAKVIGANVATFKPAHYRATFDAVQQLVHVYRDKWRDYANPQMLSDVHDCERYNEIVNKAQLACTKNFVALWQIDGDVDSLPLPESIRAILRWYRDNRGSKLPHVTREFVMYDEDLGLFGNSMLKSLKLYSCVARILQPIVCILAEGLFSCYRYSPNELAFNMMLHGRYDTGKSFMGITTLLEYTTIPDTVKIFCNATPAADTTQNHKYDMIIASDETMAWKVDSKAAERVPHLVNKEKVKMTARAVGTEVFTKVIGPLGEDVRWSRTINSDHYVSLIEITNAEVEATAALSSRYHRMVIAQPRMPAREMKGDMAALMKDHTRVYLQINQFLSAGAYKLIQCGGMLEPNLQLFHDVSNRVIDYLCLKRAIEKDQGNRTLEIMKPYVIQCIIHNAIHCVFDLPSSPHYCKEFEPSMLRDLQQYMYATVDIVWWCWTALANGWIEDNNGNVIRAACKVAGVLDWRKGATPYQMYECDVADRIPWRRHDNPAYAQTRGPAANEPNAKLVDLQYITLHGASLDSICRRIAAKTSPGLDVIDVKGAIEVMSKRAVELPGGGYMPQPEGDLRTWHKYKTLPRRDAVTGLDVAGTKETDDTVPGAAVPRMPEAFRQINPDTTVARVDADLPHASPGQAYFVVDKSESKRVHIMPHLADSFNCEIIEEALQFATLHKNMRAGKILMGLPIEANPMLLKVFHCPQAYLNAKVKELDEAMGWDNRGNWLGDDDIPVEERGTPRFHGISVNRRGGISKADAIYLTRAPMAPLRPHERAGWENRAKRAIESVSAVCDVYADLDQDSATLQHMACGRPLDEPVRSPRWIMLQYQQAMLAAGRSWHESVDYPWDNVYADAERMAQWSVASETESSHLSGPQCIINNADYVRARNQARADEHEAARARRQRWTRTASADAIVGANARIIELPGIQRPASAGAGEKRLSVFDVQPTSSKARRVLEEGMIDDDE